MGAIEEFDFEHASDRRALYDLTTACHEHDAPAGVEMIPYEGWVTGRQLPQLGFGPPRTLVWRDEGQVIGAVNVRQSAQAENAHIVLYGMGVHPGHRRRGIGKALLRAALSLMDGKTVIETRAVYLGSGGEHFATALGFRTAITWTVQRLTITELPSASEPPTGYELVRWTGTVPDEHLTAYLAGLNAMVDAPYGDMAVDTTNHTVESVRKDGADFLGAGGDIWVVSTTRSAMWTSTRTRRSTRRSPTCACEHRRAGGFVGTTSHTRRNPICARCTTCWRRGWWRPGPVRTSHLTNAASPGGKNETSSGSNPHGSRSRERTDRSSDTCRLGCPRRP